MIDTEALRKKVIDLAIRGKLTEQLPTDGTAEELYAQIQEEKARLVKGGKIKKEKTLPEITAKEIPFEIPKNWKWYRLGEIYNILMGQSPNGMNVGTEIDGIEFHQGKIYFGEKFLNISSQRTREFKRIVDSNSVLLCVRAPVGVVNITEREISIGRGLCALTPLSGMSPYYLYYYLLSCRNALERKGTGSTFSSINIDVVKQFLIPLPPLTEQKRIVERLELIFSAIRIVNALQSQYRNNLEALKSKIIDAGIRGKLTEQLPTDGTAEELYAQIQEEKARLIKEKKIKKEKPLPAIEADEIPFEIPKNWKWVRLGDICPGIKTGSLDANQKDDNGRYPFFTCGEDVYFTMNYAFDCDAILLGGNNASGDYKMHRYCGKFNAYQRVYVITGLIICLDYIFWIIKYWLPHLKVNSQGMTTRFIKIGQVTNMLTPLPPLTEQKRIAQKIDKILRVIQ